MRELCKFRWGKMYDPYPHIRYEYECIRRKGHSGNHVSYPSGEEHYNDSESDAHAGIPANEHAERNRTSSDD